MPINERYVVTHVSVGLCPQHDEQTLNGVKKEGIYMFYIVNFI